MTNDQKQALKVLIECARESMKTRAVDANLVLMMTQASSGAQSRAKRYREIAAAVAVVEGMMKQGELSL